GGGVRRRRPGVHAAAPLRGRPGAGGLATASGRGAVRRGPRRGAGRERHAAAALRARGLDRVDAAAEPAGAAPPRRRPRLGRTPAVRAVAGGRPELRAAPPGVVGGAAGVLRRRRGAGLPARPAAADAALPLAGAAVAVRRGLDADGGRPGRVRRGTRGGTAAAARGPDRWRTGTPLRYPSRFIFLDDCELELRRGTANQRTGRLPPC